MKRNLIIILFLTICFAMPVQSKAQLGIAEVIKAGVKKVVKAIDLKVQRLQNKTIWLQNAQKVLENNLSKLRLAEISEWTDRQRKLYKDYYESLSKVKSIISYYHQIKDISNKQIKLVSAYHQAWNLTSQDRNFSPEELDYIARVYSGILKESLRNIDRMLMVVNSFQTQMSDAQRLKLIRIAAQATDQNYFDLLRFNQQNIQLSLSRTKTQNQGFQIRKWYGLE